MTRPPLDRYFHAVRLERDKVPRFEEYPFCIPAVRHLRRLEFHPAITLFHRLVYHRSQLIIATHSPILLAYPNARIYEFSERGIAEVKYTDTEHFQITRDLLNRHERMLEILMSAEEKDLKAKER